MLADSKNEQIKKCIQLCNKNWDTILNEAASRMFSKVKNLSKYDDKLAKILEKFPDKETVKDNLVLESATYDNEGNKYNPLCGSMNLSFDTKPSLDPYHVFTLYIDFDKNSNIHFDSAYDG